MRAVIHIGMPKAGSCSIQTFLNTNAAALQAQGIAYRRFLAPENQPEYMLNYWSAQGRLPILPARALNISSADDLKRLAAGFEVWLDGQLRQTRATTWLASSEFISNLLHRPRHVASLHDWLSARFDEVRYVLYLRRQDDWIASCYSQALRKGSTLTFDAFVARATVWNYDELVRRWEAAAGPRNVSVRLFERSAFEGGDLIDDFCAAAGIDPAGLERPGRVNRGYAPAEARALRLTNAAIDYTLRFGHNDRIERRLRKLASEVTHALFSHGGRSLQLSPEQSQAVLARCEASNEALRRRRFPDRARLFDNSPPPPEAAPPPPGARHRQKDWSKTFRIPTSTGPRAARHT